MDFLFFILIIFLAIISNFSLTTVLLAVRVGLSYCNEILISNEWKDYEKTLASSLKNKYFIILVIHTLIICSISAVVIFLLPKYIISYFIVLFIFFIFSVGKTGKNEQNTAEFYSTLTKQENYINQINKEILDNEESKKTRLNEILENPETISNIINGKEEIIPELLLGKINPYNDKKMEKYDDIIDYLKSYLKELEEINETE